MFVYRAVQNAYKELLLAKDVTLPLPGHSSTVSSVSDIGLYAQNVVQTEVELGVAGLPLNTVNETVAGVKANGAAFTKLNYTLDSDENGVAIKFNGPGLVSHPHITTATRS